MRRHRRFYWQAALCLVLAAGVGQACATETPPTLEQLRESGRLIIKTWVEPDTEIVVQQQVNLSIEVSTNTWFTAGTRIGRLELEDAVVLRREQFAVNSTRRLAGETFTVQRWSITLYPQRAGRYDIPPLDLTLSIAGEAGTSIVGRTMTHPVSFEARMPPGMEGIKNWIAGTDFKVVESYNRKLDDLEPGDAVQRQITISAENIAAMMLPEITAEAQDGLAVYQKPPHVSDDNNRGAYRARRIESITYMIEGVGSYRLPARTFYWWDLDSRSMRSATLPEQMLDATGGAAGVDPDATAVQAAKVQSWRHWLWPGLAIAIVLGTAAVFMLRRRHQPAGRNRTTDRQQPSARVLLHRLEQNLEKQDWQQLVQTLYSWLDTRGDDDFNGSIRDLLRQLESAPSLQAVDELMQAAWYQRDASAADIEAFVRELIQEVEQSRHPPWWRPAPVSLKLN